MAKSN